MIDSDHTIATPDQPVFEVAVSTLASAQPQSDPLEPAPDSLELRDAKGDRPPDREAVRVLVIGSRHGVMTMIQTLIHLRFATMADWSPLLPGPNPGEVMRILTRYIVTQGD